MVKDNILYHFILPAGILQFNLFAFFIGETSFLFFLTYINSECFGVIHDLDVEAYESICRNRKLHLFRLRLLWTGRPVRRTRHV